MSLGIKEDILKNNWWITNWKIQKISRSSLERWNGEKTKWSKCTRKKWFKQATKAWETLISLDIPHKNKDKPVLGSILDSVLDHFLGIHEWGQHIAPVRFNKLITGIDFAEYLRSSKCIFGVKPLKQAWRKATWREREDVREEFVDEFLWWNKKIERYYQNPNYIVEHVHEMWHYIFQEIRKNNK